MSVVQCSIYAETTLFDSSGCVWHSPSELKESHQLKRFKLCTTKIKVTTSLFHDWPQIITPHITTLNHLLPLPLNFIWAHSYHNF